VPPSGTPPRKPSARGLTVLKTLRESVALLGTKRFGTFWFASLLSSLGTWAQQVAEPWLLLTLGASPFLIGLDSFAMNAPVWLLTLVGGALADRADRRRVIAVFQSIQMLCPTAIVALLVAGWIHPWMIIALSVVVGVTDALSMPSFQSIVPSIVERRQIGRGLALNSTQFNLSRILGPTIAGLLISSVGAVACFVVSAVSYVPFIGVALWILPPWAPPAAPSEPETGPRKRPFDAILEIVRQPSLRTSLLTVLTTGTFCSPLVTFVPVLVRDVFHGDAGHFSAALASFGGGGLVGAVMLLGVAPGVDKRKLSSAFAFVYAGALVLIALGPWFLAIPPLLVVAGAAMTVSNTSANTCLQSDVRPDLLGQAVSLYMLALRGGMSLGALITGMSVAFLGVRHALLLNGCVALALQTLIAQTRSRSPEAARA
jgi:predicted MFS family arabinose efflux permease